MTEQAVASSLAPQEYQELLSTRLSPDDDSSFWRAATDHLLREVEVDLASEKSSAPVYAQIGACSHWLRPHQTTWTAGGGFAWPAGYAGSQQSRLGLPEFDWFVLLRRDVADGSWHLEPKFAGSKQRVFRAALPTRTRRHAQAAVHTIWTPGLLEHAQQPHVYGFRKMAEGWQCVAASFERGAKTVEHGAPLKRKILA